MNEVTIFGFLTEKKNLKYFFAVKFLHKLVSVRSAILKSTVNHLLQLARRQLIKLHLEGERLLGHRLVRGVVVSAQVLVSQSLLDWNQG